MNYNMSPMKKFTFSAVIIAVYVIIMFITQAFAFGQFQIRIATSLYSLSALFPFLIIPLGIANSLSNILGGLGIYDIIGGFFVGVITSSLVYLIKKNRLNDWLIALPIIFVPGLIVSIWLSYILEINYFIFAITLSLEQIIPGIFGVVLYKEFKKRVTKED